MKLMYVLLFFIPVIYLKESLLKNEQSRPKDAKKKCLALDIFNEKKMKLTIIAQFLISL